MEAVLGLRISFIRSFANWHLVSILRRTPQWIIADLALPISLFILVYLLSNGKLAEYAIAGGILAVAANTGIGSAGSSAYFRMTLHIEDLLIPTKISKIDYMMGFMLSYLFYSSPGLALYAILGLAYNLFNPVNVLVTVFVLALMAVASTSIGLFVSSLVKNQRAIWAIPGILSVALTVIPPLFYPYTVLPKALLYIFMLVPVTSASMLLQGYYSLSPINNLAFIVLAVETVAYFMLAVKFMKWGGR